MIFLVVRGPSYEKNSNTLNTQKLMSQVKRKQGHKPSAKKSNTKYTSMENHKPIKKPQIQSNC